MLTIDMAEEEQLVEETKRRVAKRKVFEEDGIMGAEFDFSKYITDFSERTIRVTKPSGPKDVEYTESKLVPREGGIYKIKIRGTSKKGNTKYVHINLTVRDAIIKPVRRRRLIHLNENNVIKNAKKLKNELDNKMEDYD